MTPLLRRAALVLSALLVVVLVAGSALTVLLIRRPLPDHGGVAEIDGLDAEVQVLRDERGVPQIFAGSDDDLFRAQGYVHAQDRFFEMDYRRHVASGRLSELVGVNQAAQEADAVIRTFGWRQVAEQEWQMLDPATRSYFEAYAEGVNAYLRDREASELSVEYTVLGTMT
ncbi:penicillin acylase family protein, partial [Georgenia sp. 10Sc9-8]|nr:penicillin acylase family protein [Georgenia halotolerans]